MFTYSEHIFLKYTYMFTKNRKSKHLSLLIKMIIIKSKVKKSFNLNTEKKLSTYRQVCTSELYRLKIEINKPKITKTSPANSPTLVTAHLLCLSWPDSL
jgi:hypothetical protein